MSSGFLQSKEGNSSSRRLLAFIFGIAGLAFFVVALFLNCDWKVLLVVGGVPILACLILLFFTTWSDVAQVVNAFKGKE